MTTSWLPFSRVKSAGGKPAIAKPAHPTGRYLILYSSAAATLRRAGSERPCAGLRLLEELAQQFSTL